MDGWPSGLRHWCTGAEESAASSNLAPSALLERAMTIIRTPVDVLRAGGHRVEPSDIPGLVLVDGRELTMNQVRNMAAYNAPAEAALFVFRR